MGRRVGIPYFGNPPQQYEQRYFADLVRAFAQFANLMVNPGEGRFTTVVLTDLQPSDQTLETGTLFEWDGFVKVAKADAPHLASTEITSATGSVGVTIA